MNNRTSFALLAVLIAVGTLTMSSAYAVEGYQGAILNPEEAKALARELLLKDLPVSVWTDKT